MPKTRKMQARDKLIRRVAKQGHTNMALAERLVEEYEVAMELKKKYKDVDSKVFSFGGVLDDVWHCHILGHEEHDMMRWFEVR